MNITLLNRVSGKDTLDHLDAWYKSKLTNVEWTTETVSTINRTDIEIGEKYIVLLPFDKRYVEYNDYISADKTSHYTVSVDDYVVLGDLEEEITSDNVVDVVSKSKCRVVRVKSYRTAEEKHGIKVQVKIEGV